MPDSVRYILLIAMASWALWYFSKMLHVAFTTGRVIDSRPMDGVRATRENKPVAFWISAVIAAAMVPLMIYLIGLLGGALLGLWDADL